MSELELKMGHLADDLRLKPIDPSSDHSPPTSTPYSQPHSPDYTQFTIKPKNGNEITFSNTQPASMPPSRARNLTPSFITPLGSPLRKALHLTKLDPKDAWLPITESRNGNAYYAAFHTLCSGIGIQALLLPFAFAVLGW